MNLHKAFHQVLSVRQLRYLYKSTTVLAWGKILHGLLVSAAAHARSLFSGQAKKFWPDSFPICFSDSFSPQNSQDRQNI